MRELYYDDEYSDEDDEYSGEDIIDVDNMSLSLIKTYAPDVYNTYEYTSDEGFPLHAVHKIFLEQL